MAMSTLIELGWSTQLAAASSGLYHSDTHTVVRAVLTHERYYVTEHNLSCSPLRNTCASGEAAIATHTGGSYNRDQDDEVTPLIDEVTPRLKCN